MKNLILTLITVLTLSACATTDRTRYQARNLSSFGNRKYTVGQYGRRKPVPIRRVGAFREPTIRPETRRTLRSQARWQRTVATD